MKLHESHNWRYSDSSLYDAVCTKCNYTDESPQAAFPCGEEQPSNAMLELAKLARLKGQSEIALSPHEKEFGKLIIKECIDILESITFNNSDEMELAVDKIKEHFGLEGD